MKNISLSSTLYDLSQEGQSSSQKEEAKSVHLGKPEGPVLAEQKISYCDIPPLSRDGQS
jgi:hypothetical protein